MNKEEWGVSNRHSNFNITRGKQEWINQIIGHAAESTES